jgi:hypothetical protein
MSVGIAEVVDAGDVVPAALDQVMGNRGADDAAQAEPVQVQGARRACRSGAVVLKDRLDGSVGGAERGRLRAGADAAATQNPARCALSAQNCRRCRIFGT